MYGDPLMGEVGGGGPHSLIVAILIRLIQHFVFYELFHDTFSKISKTH